ncbi:MAG: hypothetical protein H6805_10740 [Planctomycetes bacterium]|nr:hypothetical protein [Planctomycetota bacterium]
MGHGHGFREIEPTARSSRRVVRLLAWCHEGRPGLESGATGDQVRTCTTRHDA